MSELPQAEIDAATSSVGRTETQSMILDTESLRRY